MESNNKIGFKDGPDPPISSIHKVKAAPLAKLDDDEILGLVESSLSGSNKTSEWSKDDLDTDYESKILLMTSISNLISSSVTPLQKRRSSAKKKFAKSQAKPSHSVEEPIISLHETYLKQEMDKDGRGIRDANPRQSILNSNKFDNTKRWDEILHEKDETSESVDSVKLIHESNLVSTIKVTQSLKLKRLTIGSRSQNPLFNALVSFATKAYGMVS